MRLSRKFVSAALITAAACASICICAVMQLSFSALLAREAENVQRYCDCLFAAVKMQLSDSEIVFYSDPDTAAQAFESQIEDFLPGTLIENVSEDMFFAIADNTGKALYSNLPDLLSPEPIADGHASWRIKSAEGHTYLIVSRPAQIGNSFYFIETACDESAVFAERDKQLLFAIALLAALLFAAFLVLMFASRFFLRRVVLLTHTAKRLAGGDLSVRADESSDDELAVLSANINRMTQRISTQMEALREESERKELFIGAFSHELKTPMTSIIGYADLMLRKDLTQDQQHLCLNYIFTEGKRLENMSMRLLDLIVLGKQEIYKKPVPIRSLVKDVVTLIMPKLTDADIRLIYEISPGEIEMEQELMKTVFINLVDNACNAMDAGGEIRIIGKWRNGDYLLSVRDNGKGMDAAVLSHITDAFYMADKSRSRQRGGAGLGLAICSRILSLHGFSIRFESTQGVGTLAEVTMKGGAQ